MATKSTATNPPTSSLPTSLIAMMSEARTSSNPRERRVLRLGTPSTALTAVLGGRIFLLLRSVVTDSSISESSPKLSFLMNSTKTAYIPCIESDMVPTMDLPYYTTSASHVARSRFVACKRRYASMGMYYTYSPDGIADTTRSS